MDPSALRDLLVSWAHINSGSTNLDGLARMREALAREFSSLSGATVEAVPLPGTPAQALRVTLRPEAPVQLLFNGHYDTVYGADHRFQRCEAIDAVTLRGPGVADMKGGIVVLLAVLRAFEKTPHAARVGGEILLTPDEETGSVATRPLLEAVAASRRHRLALVFEPARETGTIVRSRKGTGIFTATCRGRAAHAGRDPREGRNAIVALAEFIVAAHRLPDELPGLMLNVGAVRGGGAVNIVPDLASADINIRISRVSDATRVVERLRELAATVNSQEGYRLEIEGQFNRMPLEPGPVGVAMFTAWQQCARDIGLAAPDWTDIGGGSDANLLSAAGLPCLDGLGPIGGNLHSENEFVHLPSLVERARITLRFLEQLARGEITIAANS